MKNEDVRLVNLGCECISACGRIEAVRWSLIEKMYSDDFRLSEEELKDKLLVELKKLI